MCLSSTLVFIGLAFEPLFMVPIKSKYRDGVSCHFTTQHGFLSKWDDWNEDSSISIYPDNPCHHGGVVTEIEVAGAFMIIIGTSCLWIAKCLDGDSIRLIDDCKEDGTVVYKQPLSGLFVVVVWCVVFF